MGRSRRDRTGSVYGKPRGRYRNNPAENDEIILQSMYERILGELAMNRFKWTGFPDTVNQRFLEYQLHTNGLIVVFRDTGTNKRPGTDAIMALRGSPSGQRTMMDDPVSYTLTGPGMGEHFQGVVLSARRCVPIWPNYFRTTDWDIIETYSRKLAKIDRTLEINMDNARRTRVLIYDENTRLAAENLNREIDSGAPAVRVKYDPSALVTSFDLGVEPKTLESLSVLRGRLWSEAMGLLGINNANQDKKERLVESEVSANDDQVDNMRFVNLNARQQACYQMRKMFPDELGKVWVEFRSDALAREREIIESQLGIESEGGTGTTEPYDMGKRLSIA